VKVCFRYIKVSLKGVQTSLQNNVTWIEFLGRGEIGGRILALLLGWRSQFKNLLSEQGLSIKSSFFPT